MLEKLDGHGGESAPAGRAERARNIRQLFGRQTVRPKVVLDEDPGETLPDDLVIPELEGLDDIQKTIDILATDSDLPPTAAVDLPTPEEKLHHAVKMKLIDELTAASDNRQFSLAGTTGRTSELREFLKEAYEKITGRMTDYRIPPAKRNELIQQTIDEIEGSGPLEPLLADPSVSEIMVNGPRRIFVEQKGKLVFRPDIKFLDDTHLLNIIARIVNRIGRRIDFSNPHVDARLADGSRVHAIIPPLALDGCVLTIRKFSQNRVVMEDLVAWGALTPDMSYFLGAGVKARLNIFVAGGTGTGKTTFLNILSTLIPGNQRLVTIEDSAELRIHETHPHVVRLETRATNAEGKGEISIRDLVRDALRMRPDRIIVGECRGAEVVDMLQAMNTGHDGSMSTAHANSAQEMLLRLETMFLMGSVHLPAEAIRRQIASAIDIVVHLKRFADGTRRVAEICAVEGIDVHGDVAVRPLFQFRETGRGEDGKVLGEFRAAAEPPHFIYKFEAEGMNFPADIFTGGISA